MSAIDSFEQFFKRLTDKSAIGADDDRRLYVLGERSGLPKIIIRAMYFLFLELHGGQQ
jgi:hypothetical protein